MPSRRKAKSPRTIEEYAESLGKVVVDKMLVGQDIDGTVRYVVVTYDESMWGPAVAYSVYDGYDWTHYNGRFDHGGDVVTLAILGGGMDYAEAKAMANNRYNRLLADDIWYMPGTKHLMPGYNPGGRSRRCRLRRETGALTARPRSQGARVSRREGCTTSTSPAPGWTPMTTSYWRLHASKPSRTHGIVQTSGPTTRTSATGTATVSATCWYASICTRR